MMPFHHQAPQQAQLDPLQDVPEPMKSAIKEFIFSPLPPILQFQDWIFLYGAYGVLARILRTAGYSTAAAYLQHSADFWRTRAGFHP